MTEAVVAAPTEQTGQGGAQNPNAVAFGTSASAKSRASPRQMQANNRRASNNAAMESAREKYTELCKQSWVRPNSEVLRTFGECDQGQVSSITTLDFFRNYIGDAGGRAVFACLRLLPNLAELNVRSNGLRDGAVVFLCNSIAQHPSLGVLDVSDNEINDSQGGKALVHLVTENILITKLRCDNTRMTEKTKATITATVLNNCRNAPKMLRKNAYETTSSGAPATPKTPTVQVAS